MRGFVYFFAACAGGDLTLFESHACDALGSSKRRGEERRGEEAFARENLPGLQAVPRR